jgi:dTDP-4-amino-4,6-dideoxygalactose transaminase
MSVKPTRLNQNNEIIYVTKPALPPLEEFVPYLEKIWNSKILTNNGSFHKQLEDDLADYLGVSCISLFCNGTIALLTALQALDIQGEVITTPYSFVATAHCLIWNKIKPVFVDIEPECCNLDPEKIEAAITSRTTAVLPVHVYGNPCDVEAIQAIADKHGLKVIYDAAHAFGVKKNGISMMNHGDLSVLSFHATKAFTTFEGGAIVSRDRKTKERIDKLKNFGFAGETSVVECGINGKMNEIQAAFGVLYLKYIESYVKKRKAIVFQYRDALKNIDGIRLMNDIEGVVHNYGYFPVFVDEEKYGISRDALYEKLKRHNIYGRRYFYPLISQFSAYRDSAMFGPGTLPVAEKTAEQVVCLPVYPDLGEAIVDVICHLFDRSAN